MSLITIGNFHIPPPSVGSYVVACESVVRKQTNVRGVDIGEFIRYKHNIRWSYKRLSAANNAAIAAAIKTNSAGTSLTPVFITYWDPDSNSFQTGYFLAGSTGPRLDKFAPSAMYDDVTFELNEL